MIAMIYEELEIGTQIYYNVIVIVAQPVTSTTKSL
jgi:hypothetical protein